MKSFFFLVLLQAFGSAQGTPSYEGLTLPQKLLVIAPHPDDSVLLSGGLIQRVLQQGGEVFVVGMTLGDSKNFFGIEYAKRTGFQKHKNEVLNYGLLRWEEDQKALLVLQGNQKIKSVYLGYPDGSLFEILQTKKEGGKKSVPSKNHPYEGVPYPFAHHPGAKFTYQNLVQDLSDQIDFFQPDMISVPHPNDHHLDHAASFFLTVDALKISKLKNVIVRTPLDSHSADFSLVMEKDKRVEPRKKLLPPSETLWFDVDLDHDQIEKKAYALSLYRSQLSWEHPLKNGPITDHSYLFGHVRKNEMFGEVLEINFSMEYQKRIEKKEWWKRVKGLWRNLWRGE